MRRNLNAGIGFESVNSHVIKTHGSEDGVQLLVVDATFNEKSGRHTPNLIGSITARAVSGEGIGWSVVAVVDVQQNTAYALS